MFRRNFAFFLYKSEVILWIFNWNSVSTLSYKKGKAVRGFSYVSHELIYFYSGRGKIYINDIPYHYQPNSVLLTQSKGCKKTMMQTAIANIHVYGLKVWNIYKKFRSGLYVLKDQSVYQLFKSIKREYAEKKISYHELCNMKTAEILVELLRNSLQCEKDSDIYKINKGNRFYNAVSETYCGYCRRTEL